MESRYLLQKLCDVFAAALGPGPRVGVIVESGCHDMILVLHACLSTLGVVIMRHVEPGAQKERDTHTQGDYQLLNGSAVARRINVTRFTFSHFSQIITPYHHCEPPHTYPATSVSNAPHFAHFFPLVCGLFVSLCTYTPLFKQPAKCLNSKILEKPEKRSNWPTGIAMFQSKRRSLSVSIYPLHRHGKRTSGKHLNLIHGRSSHILKGINADMKAGAVTSCTSKCVCCSVDVYFIKFRIVTKDYVFVVFCVYSSVCYVFCGCICQKIVKNGHCKFKEHKEACGSLNQQKVDIVCMYVNYNLITQI